VDWPARDPGIPTGTPLLRRIRSGFHPKPQRNELHVVLDLEDPWAQLVEVRLDGARADLVLGRGPQGHPE
jgi:hypothetical protein